MCTYSGWAREWGNGFGLPLENEFNPLTGSKRKKKL